MVFVCLTGCLPWQKAACDDPRYSRYLSWQTATIIKRRPKLFKLVSSKAQKLFKKYLEPKAEKRPAGLAELYRFMDDRWMSKDGMEQTNEECKEEGGLCPSMYSFHSSPEEKNKLLFSLTQYGLETTVDRSAKKDRIRQWIQASVIEEEDEEELDEENIRIHDQEAGPAGERVKCRGPVSDQKIINNNSQSKKPVVYSPPIDPRIPFEQQKDKYKTKTLVTSNSDNSTAKQTLPNVSFSVKNSLPFQNLKIADSTLLETLTSDINNTIKHNKDSVPIPRLDRLLTRSPLPNSKTFHKIGQREDANKK